MKCIFRNKLKTGIINLIKMKKLFILSSLILSTFITAQSFTITELEKLAEGSFTNFVDKMEEKEFTLYKTFDYSNDQTKVEENESTFTNKGFNEVVGYSKPKSNYYQVVSIISYITKGKEYYQNLKNELKQSYTPILEGDIQSGDLISFAYRKNSIGIIITQQKGQNDIIYRIQLTASKPK